MEQLDIWSRTKTIHLVSKEDTKNLRRHWTWRYLVKTLEDSQLDPCQMHLVSKEDTELEGTELEDLAKTSEDSQLDYCLVKGHLVL